MEVVGSSSSGSNSRESWEIGKLKNRTGTTRCDAMRCGYIKYILTWPATTMRERESI